MFENAKGGIIRIILFVLMIHLVVMSIEALWAKGDVVTGTKERILTVIKAKDRGFINTDKYRFLLVESTKISDIEGNTIPFYKVPVPVEAIIVFERVQGSDPHVLEMIIQKEIISRSQPE
jgi:hypothetical protein